MTDRPIHLHSIIVHAVIGLAPLAAVALILEAAQVHLGSLGPDVWHLLLRGSVAAMFLIAIPSTLTGIAERDHMYANWHRSHRTKLWLSIALLVLTAYETAVLWSRVEPVAVVSWSGIAVVLGNPIVVFWLSYYGLRITLGRQTLARTSYVPDMHRKPPVDILEAVAAWGTEDPKLVDVLGERDA